jgi:hypothetical protein
MTMTTTPPESASPNTERYLGAISHAILTDLPKIAKWITTTCPECGNDINDPLADDEIRGWVHTTIAGALAIACEGYFVISPIALGLGGGWMDWTEHDMREVTDLDLEFDA